MSNEDLLIWSGIAGILFLIGWAIWLDRKYASKEGLRKGETEESEPPHRNTAEDRKSRVQDILPNDLPNAKYFLGFSIALGVLAIVVLTTGIKNLFRYRDLLTITFWCTAIIGVIYVPLAIAHITYGIQLILRHIQAPIPYQLRLTVRIIPHIASLLFIYLILWRIPAKIVF